MFQTRAIIVCVLFATVATSGVAKRNRERDNIIKKLIEAELANLKIEQAGYPASKTKIEQGPGHGKRSAIIPSPQRGIEEPSHGQGPKSPATKKLIEAELAKIGQAGYPASKAKIEQGPGHGKRSAIIPNPRRGIEEPSHGQGPKSPGRKSDKFKRDTTKKLIEEAELAKIEQAGHPASKAETAHNSYPGGYPSPAAGHYKAKNEQFGNPGGYPFPGSGKRSANILSPPRGIEEPSSNQVSGRKRRSAYVQPPPTPPPGKQQPAPGLPGFHEREPRSAQLLQWPPPTPPVGKQQPGEGKEKFYHPPNGRKLRSAEPLQRPPKERDVIKKLIEAELAKIEQAGYPASIARNEQLAGYPASKARNEQLAGYPASKAETEQFGHNSYQWPWPGHGKRSADIPNPLPGIKEPSHGPMAKSPGRKRRSAYIQPPAIPSPGKQQPGEGKESYRPQQGNGIGKESYGPQHGRKQRSAELLQRPPPTVPPGKQEPGVGKVSYGPPGSEREARSVFIHPPPRPPMPG